MASMARKISKDVDIDETLTNTGLDSERSLAEDADDLLDVFSGTLTFGEQHRNASLNFETDLPGEVRADDFSDSKKVQARVAFEIVNASIVGEGRQRYVAYTILVLKGPGISTAEAVITRRYSDFERLHSSLKRNFPNELRGISFPKKILTGNFKPETIAQRSRAFEQYLCHVYTINTLRVSHEFLSFFYEDDLRKAYDCIRNGNYKSALPVLKSCLLLQQRLQGEHHPEVFATLCALVAVHAELEQESWAQNYAESAFMCVQNDNRSEYLPALLELSIRLCWKLGKDKRDLEARQQELKKEGINVDGVPSLLSLIQMRYNDS